MEHASEIKESDLFGALLEARDLDTGKRFLQEDSLLRLAYSLLPVPRVLRRRLPVAVATLKGSFCKAFLA
jgi:hypothetical protein